MPYSYGDHYGSEARGLAALPKPFGLGLTAEQVASVHRVHHVASSFKDPGPDWNRFDVYDAAGTLILSLKEDGY